MLYKIKYCNGYWKERLGKKYIHVKEPKPNHCAKTVLVTIILCYKKQKFAMVADKKC